MASSASSSNVCVDSKYFYEQLEALKNSSKSKTSTTTLFISDEFYEQAELWLKASEEERRQSSLSNNNKTKIARKKWTFDDTDGKIVNNEGKYVTPKSKLYEVLSSAHVATCHRGRDKLDTYLKKSYMGISQQVITVFTSLCKLHHQQKSITSYCKKPITKPIQANGFLCHVEIDLMDFRKIPCNCSKKHCWILHVEDHFSKYSWLIPLKSKETSEVAQNLEPLFWMFGFPETLHSDNGKEFKSRTMAEFCKKHNIKQVHGAPRNPSTQGLVERANRNVKENIFNLIKENDLTSNYWCKFVNEAAYKKNITLHRAIAKVPYEVVFGFLPRKENSTSLKSTHTTTQNTTPTTTEETGQNDDQVTNASLLPEPQHDQPEQELQSLQEESAPHEQHKEDSESEPERQQYALTAQKRKLTNKQIYQTQEKYNKKMKEARPSKEKFEVNDYVSLKISKVDKTPLHPNVLLGQIIELEKDYARIVTKFGVISTYISQSRLTKTRKPNITFDSSKQITLTAASKMADQQ